MTTELTDEQLREAAMKASRLEVERAPIASTELTDTALCQALNDVCRTFHKGEEHKCLGSLAADRLAERNAAIERVTTLCNRWESAPHAFWHSASEKLHEALAPTPNAAPDEQRCPHGYVRSWYCSRCIRDAAKPSSPRCEHLWGNAPMRSAQRCEKCGAQRGTEPSEAAPNCRCDLEQWGRHHDKCQYSSRILAYFPEAPDAQREARERSEPSEIETRLDSAIYACFDKDSGRTWPARVHALRDAILAAAKPGERR